MESPYPYNSVPGTFENTPQLQSTKLMNPLASQRPPIAPQVLGMGNSISLPQLPNMTQQQPKPASAFLKQHVINNQMMIGKIVAAY